MACSFQDVTGRAAETLIHLYGQGKPLPAATLSAQSGCTSHPLFQKAKTEKHVEAGLYLWPDAREQPQMCLIQL